MEQFFKTRSAWRQWLEKYHDSKDDIWIAFYKKKTGKKSISYNEAVEEAICFGWIDSKLQSVDDEYYIQHFTPRRRGSKWSRLNMSRAEKMVRLGLMAPSGETEYRKALEDNRLLYEDGDSKEAVITDDLLKALEDAGALENFRNFPPSTRKMYTLWLNSAKRDITRKARIDRIVENSLKNIRPSML